MSTHTITETTKRRYSVIAADGVEIAVREFGPRHAATTVVLLHGHTLRSESWAFVRSHLLRGRHDLRVVSYDHRGHGRSGEGAAHTYHIDQLARDLHAVLEIAAPTGSVVLAGHSMGAMTILSFARQFPQEIGTRVRGVALVAGAAGGLTETGAGRHINHPVVDLLRKAALRAPGAMTHAKRLAGEALTAMIDRKISGSRPVTPGMKTLAGVMKNKTPIRTLAGFISSFAAFDETETLAMLAAIPTVIVYGTEDKITPQEMSLSMASRIPGAHLRPVLNAGHGLIVEQSRPVAHALEMLTGHVTSWSQMRVALAA